MRGREGASTRLARRSGMLSFDPLTIDRRPRAGARARQHLAINTNSNNVGFLRTKMDFKF